jgi:hypothetical protein
MNKHNDNQKGFALLLVIMILSILIVIVFQLGRQSLLDRLSFNDQKYRNQLQENMESVINLIPAILLKTPNSISHQFSIEPYTVEIQFQKQDKKLNLNDLKNDIRNKAVLKDINKKLTQLGLKPLYPILIGYISKSTSPIYHLNQLQEVGFSQEDIVDLAQIFSVHSKNCILVDINLGDDEKSLLAQAIYEKNDKKFICKQVRYGFQQKLHD